MCKLSSQILFVLTLIVIALVGYRLFENRKKTIAGKDVGLAKEECQNRVTKVVDYFNKTIIEKDGLSKIFSEISNPLSELNKDFYTFIYDFDGNCVAIGTYQNRIGKNFMDEKDKNGIFFVKEMINKAAQGGGWVEYNFHDKDKISYVLPAKDPATGKNYVIGAGYYLKD